MTCARRDAGGSGGSAVQIPKTLDKIVFIGCYAIPSTAQQSAKRTHGTVPSSSSPGTLLCRLAVRWSLKFSNPAGLNDTAAHLTE